MFTAAHMLGKPLVSDENQKITCKSSSCEMTHSNVTFKYLSFQWMDGYNYSSRGGFPFIRFRSTPSDVLDASYSNAQDLTFMDAFTRSDYCIKKDTKSCLSDFFGDSKANDVLLFCLGMAYHRMFNEAIDMPAWLAHSAIAFKRYISELFNGIVIRFTNAHVVVSKLAPQFQKYKHQFDHLKEVNDILWSVWKPRLRFNDSMNVSADYDEHEWYTIDQASINMNGSHLYSDAVHYPGVLTRATIYQVIKYLFT
jgi:hypothetical protein